MGRLFASVVRRRRRRSSSSSSSSSSSVRFSNAYNSGVHNAIKLKLGEKLYHGFQFHFYMRSSPSAILFQDGRQKTKAREKVVSALFSGLEHGRDLKPVAKVWHWAADEPYPKKYS